MGDIVFTGGHLCVDLNNIQMSGDQQRELLRAVEQVVVQHLAKISKEAKVVTITLAPNNGARPKGV